MIGMPNTYVKGYLISSALGLPHMMLKDRFQKALDYRISISVPGERITKAGLARACAVSAPSVNDWFSGKTLELMSGNLLDAAGYLKVRPLWLSEERGPMKLDEETETMRADKDFVERESARVPVVGEARLGTEDGYYDEYEYPTGRGEGYVVYPMKDPNTYALRCKGDSMRPRIKHGEFVVIEPNRPPSIGKEVMVKTVDGRKMIKILAYQRHDSIELHSINENHKPITLDLADVESIQHVGGIFNESQYYPYEAA